MQSSVRFYEVQQHLLYKLSTSTPPPLYPSRLQVDGSQSNLCWLACKERTLEMTRWWGTRWERELVANRINSHNFDSCSYVCICHRTVRAPVPWHNSYRSTKESCRKNLFITNPVMMKIQNLWYDRWVSLNLIFSLLWKSYLLDNWLIFSNVHVGKIKKSYSNQ